MGSDPGHRVWGGVPNPGYVHERYLTSYSHISLILGTLDLDPTPIWGTPNGVIFGPPLARYIPGSGGNKRIFTTSIWPYLDTLVGVGTLDLDPGHGQGPDPGVGCTM